MKTKLIKGKKYFALDASYVGKLRKKGDVFDDGMNAYASASDLVQLGSTNGGILQIYRLVPAKKRKAKAGVKSVSYRKAVCLIASAVKSNFSSDRKVAMIRATLITLTDALTPLRRAKRGVK